MKSCITCGMPFEGNHAGDVGLETADGPVCKFDSENGAVKSGEEIFEGGVNWFATLTDGDRDLAERLTRKNMKRLAYWKARHFPQLDGPEATDAEFGVVMSKLG